MKIIIILIAVSVFLAVSAQESVQDVSFSFKASGIKAVLNSEEYIKSDDGLLRLSLKSGTEVEDGPEGRKAIYFSGMNSEASSISRCFSACQPIEFSLKAYPLKRGDKEQNILTLAVFDLRYNYEKQEAYVFVTLEDSTFSVKAPCPVEKWNEIKVKIIDNSVSLTVNGAEVKEKFPEGKNLKKIQMYPRVGGNTTKERLFRGFLDELSLKMKSYPIVKK